MGLFAKNADLGPDELFDPQYVPESGTVFREREPQWKPPTSGDLSFIREAEQAALARMDDVACKGSAENLADCVGPSCPKRDHNSCPRMISQHAGIVRRAIQGDKSEARALHDQGIPPAIAAHFLARKYREDIPAMEAAKAWWSSNPRPLVLVLAGDPDAGKSFAASYLAWRHGGLVTTARDIVDRREDTDFMRSLRVPGLLVIDELGREALDGFDNARSALVSLLCDRAGDKSQLATVLPTNLPVESLRERYGDPFADRLKKLGSVKTFETVNMRSLSRWASVAPRCYATEGEDDDL